MRSVVAAKVLHVADATSQMQSRYRHENLNDQVVFLLQEWKVQRLHPPTTLPSDGFQADQTKAPCFGIFSYEPYSRQNVPDVLGFPTQT